MPAEYAGIHVSGSVVRYVLANHDAAGKRLLVIGFGDWDVPETANVCRDYAKFLSHVETSIKGLAPRHVVLKDSAVSQSVSAALLRSAEIRGVVKAAIGLASIPCTCIAGGTISRTYGERKVSEYLKDDTFWAGKLDKALPKKYREPAMLIINKVRP